MKKVQFLPYHLIIHHLSICSIASRDLYFLMSHPGRHVVAQTWLTATLSREAAWLFGSSRGLKAPTRLSERAELKVRERS